VQLLGGWEGYVTPDNNKTNEEKRTDEAFAEIATYASGVGHWKLTIVSMGRPICYTTKRISLKACTTMTCRHLVHLENHGWFCQFHAREHRCSMVHAQRSTVLSFDACPPPSPFDRSPFADSFAD
jgi:hypothetical protein